MSPATELGSLLKRTWQRTSVSHTEIYAGRHRSDRPYSSVIAIMHTTPSCYAWLTCSGGTQRTLRYAYSYHSCRDIQSLMYVLAFWIYFVCTCHRLYRAWDLFRHTTLAKEMQLELVGLLSAEWCLRFLLHFLYRGQCAGFRADLSSPG